MNLKCLQLSPWMKPVLHSEIGMKSYENTLRMFSPQAPVLNRPGRYLRGGWAWFELEDGRAFSYPSNAVKYELGLLEAEGVTEPQVAALREVARQKLATKKQKEILQRQDEAARRRENARQARLFMLRFKKGHDV